MIQGKTNSVVGGTAHYTIIHAHVPDGDGWICKFVNGSTTHEVTISNEEAFWDTNLAVGQTWTISIKNHSEIPSQTVTITAIDKAYEVILEVPMLTINLSLKGAKGDVIRVYNSANTLLTTCTFGSTATTGSCSVQIANTGDTLKFESQIAKDTTSGTTAYYKTQTYTASGSYTVNVYPDGALYWYGNEVVAWTKIVKLSGDVTKNTNAVDINLGSTGGSHAWLSTNNKVDLSNATYLKSYFNQKSLPSFSSGFIMGTSNDKVMYDTTSNNFVEYMNQEWVIPHSLGYHILTLTLTNKSNYFIRCGHHYYTPARSDLYAVWFE